MIASHGYLLRSTWSGPQCTVFCDKPARPGYSDIPAHEYQDHPEVLQEKVELLVRMLLLNENVIAYTGAGISTSAGISDYASRTAGSASAVNQLLHQQRQEQEKKPKSSLQARPTYAHKFLTKLYEGGLLHWWCQQNHDGLPQKAGLPQHAINEIHGAWFDPSNRVVQFDEDLRGDLYEELLRWEEKARVCLAVGTSLSGMNADRLVETCGSKGLKAYNKYTKSKPLTDEINDDVLALGGSVIIGFQQTRLDGIAALHIYASIDQVFTLLHQTLITKLQEINSEKAVRLMQQLQEPMVDDPQLWIRRVQGRERMEFFGRSQVLEEHMYLIDGYDAKTGKRKRLNISTRSTSTAKRAMAEESEDPVLLDLRVGKKLRITTGNDKDCTGKVQKITSTGNYEIVWNANVRVRGPDGKKHFEKGQVVRVMGLWMIASALEGKLAILSVLNHNSTTTNPSSVTKPTIAKKK